MRDYDPTTGRYLQADPLGLVDGASVYGYALQSPMRFTDPHGLWVVGPQSVAPPDYNPYTDDLVLCLEQDMAKCLQFKKDLEQMERDILSSPTSAGLIERFNDLVEYYNQKCGHLTGELDPLPTRIPPVEGWPLPKLRSVPSVPPMIIPEPPGGGGGWDPKKVIPLPVF